MTAVLAFVSLFAAAIAARIGGGDRWLWNLDMPKIDYPLAVFFNEALRRGELPLWNDRLGLGFPLYAEGQIGAFYPPYWILFRLDPLLALDATRVLHLALAGVGLALIALRISGSRPGAVLAAMTAPLCGAIVSKLEWTNLVAAYAWAPWVLLPLIRTPSPSTSALLIAGALWGVQALAGHPNTWVLTGLAAAAVLIGNAPRWRTLPRVALFAAAGVAVSAIQIVPTVLLASLSVRSEGMSADDVFSGATTPFDGLLFAFANAFVRNDPHGWDLPTAWYPDGSFALLEAWAYVGIPVLVLAVIGWRARRGRGLRLLVIALLAVPVVAAFRPDLWRDIPLLNATRSPTRAYIFVDLGLALLAALGVARLVRDRRALLVGRVVTATAVAMYLAVDLLAVALPATFEGLLLDFSIRVNLSPAAAPMARARAMAALDQAWPVFMEIAIALLFLLLLWRMGRGDPRRLVWPIAAVAIVPLILFSPSANPRRPFGDFVFGGNDLHSALLARAPHRVLTVGAPGWYPGMPDQLAAAGVPDISMFSSLNLAATDRLVERLRHDPDAPTLRRLVGIDTVVTFKTPCPGAITARVRSDDAYICTVDALTGPYWIPRAAARVGGEATVPWRATEATIDATFAARSAVAVQVDHRSTTELRLTVDAPAEGWVFIDRAWWPAWMTWVDGLAVTPARALAGHLVRVPPGRHVVIQRLLPFEALGALAAGLSGVGAAALLTRRRRS